MRSRPCKLTPKIDPHMFFLDLSYILPRAKVVTVGSRDFLPSRSSCPASISQELLSMMALLAACNYNKNYILPLCPSCPASTSRQLLQQNYNVLTLCPASISQELFQQIIYYVLSAVMPFLSRLLITGVITTQTTMFYRCALPVPPPYHRS